MDVKTSSFSSHTEWCICTTLNFPFDFPTQQPANKEVPIYHSLAASSESKNNKNHKMIANSREKIEENFAHFQRFFCQQLQGVWRQNLDELFSSETFFLIKFLPPPAYRHQNHIFIVTTVRAAASSSSGNQLTCDNSSTAFFRRQTNSLLSERKDTRENR